jgi:hypothetical protein
MAATHPLARLQPLDELALRQRALHPVGLLARAQPVVRHAELARDVLHLSVRIAAAALAAAQPHRRVHTCAPAAARGGWGSNLNPQANVTAR